MNALRLTIGKKLSLLVVLSAAALAGFSGYMLNGDYHLMQAERELMLRSITDNMVAEAASLQQEVEAGHMTQGAAILHLHDLLDTMRFGPARDYTFAYTTAGVSVANAGNRSLEGKNLLGAAGPDGRRPVAEMIEEGKAHGGGTLRYLWPRPTGAGGMTEPVPKLAAYKLFTPFDLLIGTSVYMDDIDAAFRERIRGILVIVGVIALLSICLTLQIARSIQRPLVALAGRMDRLSAGVVDLDIPEALRRDEIGQMARTVEIFKANAIEVRRLAVERDATKAQAELDRRSAILALGEDLDQRINSVVDELAAAAGTMHGTATSMTVTAEVASRESDTAAEAGRQAAGNVQSVAGAAEELSASIREISKQVASCSAVADEAVAEAGRTSGTVGDLVDAGRRIGEVVILINGIANQTNLLALNATIEAARAGDTGKGFAVVASEVKALATQTARATEDISAQIAAMQSATDRTAGAIQGIRTTIESVGAIAAAIAAAVEEQGAATNEIAQAVQQAAARSEVVSSTIRNVSSAAQETGVSAARMLGAAGDLSGQTRRLRQDVTTFLATLRAS